MRLNWSLFLKRIGLLFLGLGFGFSYLRYAPCLPAEASWVGGRFAPCFSYGHEPRLDEPRRGRHAVFGPSELRGTRVTFPTIER